MHKYDNRGSLAPRDIVARAIDNETKTRGDDYVLLDCTHLDKKGLIEHFPNIYNMTQSLKEVQQIMSVYVGIVRSEVRLQRASERLWIIYNETERLYSDFKVSRPLCELRNLINVAYLVIKHASARKKNVGLHFMND